MQREVRHNWPAIVLVVVLFLAAFAVPLMGPLRESGAHLFFAAAVAIVGLGAAALVYTTDRDRT